MSAQRVAFAWASLVAFGAACTMGACGGDDSSDSGGSGGSGQGGSGGSTQDGSAGNGGGANAGGAAGSGGSAGAAGSGTLAGATTVEEFEGTWTGTWESETFGLAGDALLEIDVDLAAKTLTVTVDLPNAFPGGPDPPSDTQVLSFTDEADLLANGYVATFDSKYYGDMEITFQTDGVTFVDHGDWSAQGTFDPTSATLDFFVQIPGTGVIRNEGKITLTKGGTPGTLTLTEPTFDCSPVSPTAGVGQACTGTCMPPAGGCVQSACRQSCIVGECMGLCTADDQCTLVQNETYPDGRDYAVCFPVEVGPNPPHAQCSAALGRCQQGSHCVAFLGQDVGECLPVCTTDADCPAVGSNQGACIFGTTLGGGHRYCGLRCDKNGDETCPAGMMCAAGFAGGSCYWPSN